MLKDISIKILLNILRIFTTSDLMSGACMRLYVFFFQPHFHLTPMRALVCARAHYKTISLIESSLLVLLYMLKINDIIMNFTLYYFLIDLRSSSVLLRIYISYAVVMQNKMNLNWSQIAEIHLN